MNLIDQQFEEALRDLPEQKLSWRADRRIRKMLRQKARELDGRLPFWTIIKRLVAVPALLALLFTTTSAYAFYSPAVVQGDLLYSVKAQIEEVLYPEEKSPEERIAFHLWLSERRYAEAQEIVEREALLITFETATQHVDYALLLTDEIRDPQKANEVQEQVRATLQKQKVFLEKNAPVLKILKLKEKKKGRQKKLKFETELQRLIEEPIEVETAEAFIADRLGFQESLLKTGEAKVLRAREKKTEVLLGVAERLKDLPEESRAGDQIFSKALKAHYREEKKILKRDIEQLTKEEEKIENIEELKEGDEEIAERKEKEEEKRAELKKEEEVKRDEGKEEVKRVKEERVEKRLLKEKKKRVDELEKKLEKLEKMES